MKLHCPTLLLLPLFGLSSPGVDETAPIPPPPGQSQTSLLSTALTSGQLLYDARLRYEYADQQGLREAQALTLRQRVGYETAPLVGWTVLLEGSYNWVLNAGDFTAYPPAEPAGRAVIADPESLALSQGFLAYAGDGFTLAAGRQRLNLGNQRFVGAVGWRQNEQSYDAIRLTVRPLDHWELDYLWNWRVNRIFGHRAPTDNLRRFRAENHLINAAYQRWNGIQLGAYSYLLHLREMAALSSDTFGLYAEGNTPLAEDYQLLWRTELAYQTNNQHTDEPGYGAWYGHLRAAVSRNGYQTGFAFETLGSDSGRSLQTPLATLHAFNGWADTFLTTPDNGLRDYSIWITGPLPGSLQARAEAHLYTAEKGSQRFGDEWGISLSRSLAPHLTLLLKVTRYRGRDSAPTTIAADKEKLWLQVDYRL